MGSRLALFLGIVLAPNASAFHLFPKPARVMGMRSAHVDGTSFVVMHGKLYRQDRDGTLRNLSRWPRISKIAKFGRGLAALTYQGDLQLWRPAEGGEWRARTMTPATIADFSANDDTLVAIDDQGFALTAHPGSDDEGERLEPVLAEVGDLQAVTGFSAERGFALFKSDRSRVLLDGAGTPCERLLGVR